MAHRASLVLGVFGSVVALAPPHGAQPRPAQPQLRTVARQTPHLAATTVITGGSDGQRTLLRKIIAALGPSHVPRLQIARVSDGVKLSARVQAPRPTWELLVTAAAFTDLSSDRHLAPVREVDALHAGWETSDAQPRPARATAASILATRRAMRRHAHASGARLVELTVSAPDALAVALRVRVADAARFLHHRLRALVIAAEAHQRDYEGVLLEVDDAHGIAWARAETRVGGQSYVRPRLAGCAPFPPPRPAPIQPDCPA